MKPKIKRRGEKLTEARLAEVEGQFGIQLPADYRAFMIENNGGDPVPTGVCRKRGKTPYRTCTSFFIIDSERDGDDWVSVNQNMHGDQPLIPSRLFMIAEDLGGNAFCISVSGKDVGKVYWWDQEDGFDPQRPSQVIPDMSGMRLMADSFEAFLNQFAEDPDEPTPESKTWEELIEARDLKGVAEWLQNGGQLNERNSSGMSPLMHAVTINCYPIVEFLLDHGAKEPEALELAVRVSRWEVLRSILARAGTPEISSETFARALESCDDVSIISGLIDVGAPLQGEHFGLCPLYSATLFKSKPEIVKLLLDRGAKQDQSAVKDSPLVHAIFIGNLRTVKHLLDSGGDLFKVPQKTEKLMKYEAQLKEEESKPKPNSSHIEGLNYLLNVERCNSPISGIDALDSPCAKHPAAFKKAVIEYATRLGQKPE